MRISIDRQTGNASPDVCMEIDEAGRYQQTRRVHDSVSVDRQATLDGSDPATDNANVANIVQSDRWIDNSSVPNDQFILRSGRLLNRTDPYRSMLLMSA